MLENIRGKLFPPRQKASQVFRLYSFLGSSIPRIMWYSYLKNWDQVVSIVSAAEESELLDLRDHIDDILDGLYQAQQLKGSPMQVKQAFRDYIEDQVDGDVLLAGDVLGLDPGLATVAQDEPEEDALGEDEPEADQHRDQQEQAVDLAGVAGDGCDVAFDHRSAPLEDEDEDGGREAAAPGRIARRCSGRGKPI